MKTVTGAWIKRLREDLGMTQAEFAFRLGASQGAVANYENEKRRPVGSTIILLDQLDLERRRLATEKISA